MNQELFGITPPNKLFVKLAVPSLVSMLFSSIYMMADGMFVGKIIGSKALAAINLVFPIIMIVFAVGDMKRKKKLAIFSRLHFYSQLSLILFL